MSRIYPPGFPAGGFFYSREVTMVKKKGRPLNIADDLPPEAKEAFTAGYNAERALPSYGYETLPERTLQGS